MTEATQYAEITKSVGRIIEGYDGNDASRACILIARSAFLHLKAMRGKPMAVEKAHQLADELIGGSDR